MPSKFLNISTDTTLGGSSASDSTVSSQKAIKAYVDSQTGTAPAFANITGQPTDNTNLASALNAKYDASNPNGYTSNVGTVTSVNNTSPDSGGNVTLSIPTVDQAYSASSTNAQSGIAVASAISGKANDSDVVKLTGNQTVAGNKTFSDDVYLTNDKGIFLGSNSRIRQDTNGTVYITNAAANAYIDVCSKTQSTSDNSTKIATTAFVINILKEIYPVGAIYIGTTSTCPLASLFGTWSSVSSGRVLQGASSGHNAGTTIEAGLPNIYGRTGIRNNGGREFNGCFYGSSDATGSYANESWASGAYAVTLDASRSSSIYGNSSTVQPPAYCVNIWKRTA